MVAFLTIEKDQKEQSVTLMCLDAYVNVARMIVRDTYIPEPEHQRVKARRRVNMVGVDMALTEYHHIQTWLL